MAMFDLPPTRRERISDAVDDGIPSIARGVLFFFSRGFVWRTLCIVIGGGSVYFTMRMIVRGDFLFFSNLPPWAGWDFVPAWTILGAILMYLGVRRRAKPPKN